METIAVNNIGIRIVIHFPDGTTREIPSKGQTITTFRIQTSDGKEVVPLYPR